VPILAISPLTDLFSWLWQACWADSVFAPATHREYWDSWVQNTASAISSMTLSTEPMAPNTIPKIAPRGRPVAARRACRNAVTPNQQAPAPTAREKITR
jgi:hypothetical protein